MDFIYKINKNLVIILLILVGITISQLTGNGIFEKAKEAKQKWEVEKQEEENFGDGVYGRRFVGTRTANTSKDLMEIDLSKFRILSYGGTAIKDGKIWSPVPCSKYDIIINNEN